MLSKILMLQPSDFISDLFFFQYVNFYPLFLQVPRQGSLSPWMPPLSFNPGKHRQMKPSLSVFLASLRAIFSYFPAAGAGGGCTFWPLGRGELHGPRSALPVAFQSWLRQLLCSHVMC